MSDSIKAQRLSERDNASIVIHGLTESSVDRQRVQDLLQLFASLGSMTHIFQLGKFKRENGADTSHDASKKSRPVKIELKFIDKRNSVLRNARTINQSDKDDKVFLTKFISMDELSKIKALRIACCDLNKSEPICSDGTQRFVVINTKVMKRQNDGTLTHYPIKNNQQLAALSASTPSSDDAASPDVSPKKGNVPPQSKNVCGGSHVAP